MRRLFCTATLLLAISGLATAQYATVYGYVRDSVSGERLENVVVRVRQTKSFTLTNSFGYYALKIAPADLVVLDFSLLSYHSASHSLSLRDDTRLDVALSTTSIFLDEIVVEGQLQPPQSFSVGKISLPLQQFELLPIAGAEMDITKLLQTAPGVLGGNELTTGIHVRGGSFDQNLYYVDGFPIYNINHLFGYFSVFQEEALHSAEVLKSCIPAQFGGRLSSVVNVSLKEGNRERYVVSGGVSVISARAAVEGPLPISEEGSFLVAARRTYLDPILSLAQPASQETDLTTFSFYDITAKANVPLSSSNRLFVSGYFGGDNFELKDQTNVLTNTWGNAAFALRLNSFWSPSVFSNATFVYSSYRESLFENALFRRPAIIDNSLKFDIQSTLSPNVYFFGGAAATYHQFRVFSDHRSQSRNSANFNIWEAAAFVALEWDISPTLRLSSGSRATYFASGSYLQVEPRLSLLSHLSPLVSLRASYDRIYQFIHSLSSFSLTSPAELLYPSNAFLKPQIGDQVALGVSVTPPDPFGISAHTNLTLEVYYKDMRNLPQIRHRFESVEPAELPNSILIGTGKSYGIEISAESKGKTLHLLMNYAWSKTTRTFAERNRGEPFPPTFHRDHVFNVMFSTEIMESLSLGATFVLASGQPTTLPEGEMSFNGLFENARYSQMVDFGDLNSERLPLYNRLDVGVTHTFDMMGGKWKLQLNVYNIYGYPNPLFNYFDVQFGKFEQLSIGLLPTLGLSFSY
ncbi:MAG: TonB-dependent receptor [Nitrososphaera sp.]|nr:TonB-dependent receptor [Nitrososphaera sp.]MCI0705856.1 TonB-dependent receptor [Ignavibacteriota bacterium]